MNINQTKQNFEEARDILNQFISDDNNWEALELAGNILVQAFKEGNKVISCGNGGSMCDAMHFAEELSGRFRDDRSPLPAIAISDPSYITCTANDYGYDQVFSRFVEGLGEKGDVLLAISTSGNSANVINAMKAAKDKGMQVIGLTGKDGGKMSGICDVEIRAPYSKYSDRTQEIHIKVIHSLIHFVELNLYN
ncbi:MAG: D-sedoheptulose 7-phosphate isomerase [Bacteroidota bacterium]